MDIPQYTATTMVKKIIIMLGLSLTIALWWLWGASTHDPFSSDLQIMHLIPPVLFVYGMLFVPCALLYIREGGWSWLVFPALYYPFHFINQYQLSSALIHAQALQPDDSLIRGMMATVPGLIAIGLKLFIKPCHN